MGTAQKPASFKVVLLGEGRVGKTSLVLRYVHGIFSPNQPATVQAAFLTKQLRLSNGFDVVLSIWDTAGQERFHALGPIYYRDADAAVLVYDVTEPNTLERVRKWVAEVRLMGPPNMALVIAANKVDLLCSETEGAVASSIEQGERYASEIGATFVQTSAKEGTGVEDGFLAAANEVAKHFLMSAVSSTSQPAPLVNRKPLLIVDDDQIVVNSRPQTSSRCCA